MPLAGASKKRYNRQYYRTGHTRGRGSQSVRRTDKKIPVTFRAYESLIAQLDRLLLEGLAGKTPFPWQTRGAMYGGLLLRGLETLKGSSPLIDDILPSLQARSRIEGMRLQRKEAQALLAVTRDEVGELLAAGAEVEASQAFHVAMEAMADMPKTVWNDHLMDELAKAFPQLVGTKPRGVSVSRKRARARR
jgi:hypothetical protein